MFNNNIVNLTTNHKHLGMIFDSKLSFDEHLKSALKKLVKFTNRLPDLNKRYFFRKALSRVRLRVTEIKKMAQETLLILQNI